MIMEVMDEAVDVILHTSASLYFDFVYDLFYYMQHAGSMVK
jgi:hypothetical protein